MTQPNTSATSATSGLHSLIALFDKAHASGHAYPNVWLTTPAEAYDIKLYRAGRSSKRPGSITIVNGQDYVGCILRNGDDIQFSSRIRSKTFLADVQVRPFADPEQAVLVSGRLAAPDSPLAKLLPEVWAQVIEELVAKAAQESK